MKMTNKNKKNTKIVAATGMAVFSLLAVFTATFAWFVLNQGIDASGIKVKPMESGKALSKMTLHRCILNQSSETKYVFDPTPEFDSSEETGSALNPQIFEILDYSDLNTTQPVLLLFHLNLDTIAKNVHLTARTNITTYVEQVTEDNVEHFPFSHGVKFQNITCSTVSFPFNNVPTSGTGGLSDPISFVTVNATGTARTGYTPTLDIFQGEGTSTMTYLGVVMDYYEAAVLYLKSNQIGTDGDAIMQENGRIGFYCDWIMEV